MPKEPQSHGSQGGDVSPVQGDENVQAVQPGAEDEGVAPKRVADQESGAKRGGFFKRRDYTS